MNEIHRVERPAEDLKFAYWVPNVSGGLVVSRIPQRTDWGLEYNVELARIAEAAGFEYALTQIRFIGSYGAQSQHESTTFSTALLASTQKLKVICAILPGPWHPALVAKLGASANHMFGGRWAINVVSGWFAGEFKALGLPWLDHDVRYRRSREFIEVLKGIWTRDNFDFNGEFYRIDDFTLDPKPATLPHPEIFQGGNSRAAQENAGAVSDWYFMNGNTLEGHRAQIENVRRLAAGNGRTVRFGVNAFVIARETEAEAHAELDAIVAQADREAVEAFGGAVKEAGQSSPEGRGMWQDSSFADLVQYNDGFKTGLIGTPGQIAEKIVALKRIGVDLVLTGFLHFQEETKFFGARVLPLVRALEADLQMTDWQMTDWQMTHRQMTHRQMTHRQMTHRQMTDRLSAGNLRP